MSFQSWRPVLQRCLVERGSAQLQDLSGDVPPPLSIESLERLVAHCFWASLQQNEHRPCVFRVATASGSWASVASLEEPQRITPDVLRKLAAASGSAWTGPSLVVEVDSDEWSCIGFGDPSTVADLRIDVLGPGNLRLSDIGGPLAAIEGQEARFLGGLLVETPLILELLGGRLGRPDHRLRATFLRRLLEELISQKTGGTICLIPSASKDEVQKSLVGPLGIAREGATRPSSLMLQALTPGPEMPSGLGGQTMAEASQQLVLELASTYARLAGADGATVLEAESLDLLCFGARIAAEGASQTRYEAAELLHDPEWVVRTVESAGGMRHRSALNLVAKHPSAVCFVCSADGPASIFFAHPAHGLRCWQRLDRLL